MLIIGLCYLFKDSKIDNTKELAEKLRQPHCIDGICLTITKIYMKDSGKINAMIENKSNKNTLEGYYKIVPNINRNTNTYIYISPMESNQKITITTQFNEREFVKMTDYSIEKITKREFLYGKKHFEYSWKTE